MLGNTRYMTILDGKKVAASVFEIVAQQVDTLKTSHSITPGLAVVIVGSDPASQVYVNMKVKRCKKLGITSKKYELPENTSQDDLLALVRQLNEDPEIHGILVQSPPPKHIDEETVIETISPAKDVDCFHPENVGRMLIGQPDGLVPCTPAGVMEIIKYYGIETSGRHAVVVGRSNIVGKPMAALLIQKTDPGNCTVTVCHSRSQNLPDIVKQADIVIAAVGRPGMVTGDMIKDGAVVIDVGINRIDDADAPKGYRLVGDVAYDEAAPKSSAITPVPGGVGPMTIAMLLRNTIRACCSQNGIDVNSL